MGFSRPEYWSGLPCPSPQLLIFVHLKDSWEYMWFWVLVLHSHCIYFETCHVSISSACNGDGFILYKHSHLQTWEIKRELEGHVTLHGTKQRYPQELYWLLKKNKTLNQKMWKRKQNQGEGRLSFLHCNFVYVRSVSVFFHSINSLSPPQNKTTFTAHATNTNMACFKVYWLNRP